MTALERLAQLGGLSGSTTGAALSRLAGMAGVAGALLATWSGLPPASFAWEHLLNGGSGVVSTTYPLVGVSQEYPNTGATQDYSVDAPQWYPVGTAQNFPIVSQQTFPATALPGYTLQNVGIAYPLVPKTFALSGVQYPLEGIPQVYPS